MSKQVKDAWGELSEAATTLENELRKFEQLAGAVRKMPLDTRKAIERAARSTSEAAREQEAVGVALGALVQRINAARERHEANARALGERGEEIRRRAEEMTPLFERYAALGDESRAVNGLVQEAAAAQREASTPERVSALVRSIEGIEDRMSKLVEGGARSVAGGRGDRDHRPGGAGGLAAPAGGGGAEQARAAPERHARSGAGREAELTRISRRGCRPRASPSSCRRRRPCPCR